MKIISQFTDYYDFANSNYIEQPINDYRELQYHRKYEVKTAEYNLQSYSKLDSSLYNRARDCYSEWWNKIKEKFRFDLEDMDFISKCLFICGKAFPFIELAVVAPVKVGKYGRVQIIGDTIPAKEFNGSNFIVKKDNELQQEIVKGNSIKFVKNYFTQREFLEDVKHIEEKRHWQSDVRDKYQKDFEEQLKIFFKQKNDDYTELHVLLDTPIISVDFSSTKLNKWGDTLRRADNDKLYRFEVNPLLQQYNFMKFMPPSTIYQEIEMFLGNALVKDVMPASFQSDLDKLTARGFDPKTSFRKLKTDKKK